MPETAARTRATTPVRERALDLFDRWLHGGSITRLSLGRFRIVYAVSMLLTFQDLHWVDLYPDALYNPPLGLMQLLPGWPPEWVMVAWELVLAVAFVALALGLRTRTTSFAITALTLVGYGYTFSLGKVDHAILLVLLPAFMALAGWGDRASLDAVRRGRAAPEVARMAPLRLFALVIGLAFLHAARPKVQGNWLDPSTYAVQNIQANQYFVQHHGDYLATWALGVHNGAFWELNDYLTIFLEAGMVLFVLSWSTTRFAFALASAFHVGVLAMMNIVFFNNILAYGFVVAWDRLPLPERVTAYRPGPRLLRAAPAIAVVVGVAWWAVFAALGYPSVAVQQLYIVLGAVVGIGYGVRVVVQLVRAVGPAGRGTLLYDADCGFCTRTARRLAGGGGRVVAQPWQATDLAARGLTEADATARAHFDDGERLLGGSEAIAAAARARGGLLGVAGRLLGYASWAVAARGVYGWVAAHRHRMPGATDACRLPTSLT